VPSLIFTGFLFLCVMLCPASARASDESARCMRNALHYYHVGNFRRAKDFFTAVIALGTPEEVAVAKQYLAEPPLLYSARSKRSIKANTPVPRSKSATDSILEEPEIAPERASRSTSDGSGQLPFRISGNLREELAARLSAPSQLSKLRTVGTMAATGQISDDISYKVSGRLWYDGVYDLTHHYPKPVSDDQKTDAELRDTYVDLSHGNWDARVGKQQIVWGEALGLFYADVVNAKDLREFVLPDFEFIRIPEWGTDLEYTLNDLHTEFIWLPYPSMDRVGRPGSEFAFPVPAIAGIQTVYGSERTPPSTLNNSEVGGRFAYRAKGWDLGLFHLYTWDKSPVYERSFSANQMILTATHPRLTIDGATFAKEVEDIIFKGELVYNAKKYFQTTDLASTNGLAGKSYVDYLLGADYSFVKNINASAQWAQRFISDYESDLYQQKRIQSNITLSVRQTLWDHWEPEILWIQNLEFGDRMVRPAVSYKMNSQWRWTGGMDFFSGNPEGLFGEFSHHNRVYTEVRYDF
jgi:hypothetical protein